LEKLGAPTTASDLGAAEEDVVKALEMAATIRPERYTILNKMDLGVQDREKLVKATGVV
jgi:glycerol-1-phosphate dehydrogenase [NAD(P)+]